MKSRFLFIGLFTMLFQHILEVQVELHLMRQLLRTSKNQDAIYVYMHTLISGPIKSCLSNSIRKSGNFVILKCLKWFQHDSLRAKPGMISLFRFYYFRNLKSLQCESPKLLDLSLIGRALKVKSFSKSLTSNPG